MKKLLATVVLCCALNLVHAQSDATVIKDWHMLVESKTMIDVSYRVVKCGDVTQIHLMVFNENPSPQEVNFDLIVSGNEEGQNFTQNVKFSAAKATIYKADCSADETKKVLKLNLPSGYDASKLTLKVNFKS